MVCINISRQSQMQIAVISDSEYLFIITNVDNDNVDNIIPMDIIVLLIIVNMVSRC